MKVMCWHRKTHIHSHKWHAFCLTFVYSNPCKHAGFHRPEWVHWRLHVFGCWNVFNSTLHDWANRLYQRISYAHVHLTSIYKHTHANMNTHSYGCIYNTHAALWQTGHKRPRHFKPLRLVVNGQSPRKVDKVTDLHALIDRFKADMLVLTEIWLDEKYHHSPVPEHDRPGQPYDGILVAISDKYLSCKVPEIKTDCKSVGVQINIVCAKKLLVCIYYRPNERDGESFEQIDLDQSSIDSRNCNTWIAGDFSFADFN